MGQGIRNPPQYVDLVQQKLPALLHGRRTWISFEPFLDQHNPGHQIQYNLNTSEYTLLSTASEDPSDHSQK